MCAVCFYSESSLVVANDYHNLAHLCKLRSNTFVYVRDEKVVVRHLPCLFGVLLIVP